MIRIEFIRPNPRVDDWRVKVNGRAVGSVWRSGDCYIASVTTECKTITLEAAFKFARQQVRSITVA